MAQFGSWLSYWNFQHSIQRDCRYIRTDENEEFLDAVRATAAARSVRVEQSSIYWRAQLGHSYREIVQGEVTFPEPCAFPATRMIPLSDRAAEGRVNPKGIPCLYLATKAEVAVSEVRPWIGAYVSLGRFETVRELRIVNCAHDHGKSLFHYSMKGTNPTPEQVETITWSNIDMAFAEPAAREDDTAGYAATQIIAELFKMEGYDGIEYRSNCGEDGHNLALFDIGAARLMDRSLTLQKVTKVTVESQEYSR